MTEPAIEVRALRKSFRDHQVLRGVDLTVDQGTVFALLGKNGAGKTTIINILTTLIPADAGTARVGGFDVAAHPESVRRHISLTGQFAAVDDVLTARENLILMGDLRHVANSRATAKELLARFGLSDAADRRVATYSGGMRRRLDIAMGLIGDPSIVFLDEPTNGLDPEGRLSMWENIRSLAHSGTTIFLTTQYLEEADELAHRVAVLHDGCVAATGTPAELKGMLPGDLVTFDFHDERDTRAAMEALKGDFDITRSETLALTVATGGGTARVAEIFIRLRDARVEPVDFTQLIPTLDDVFFSLTGGAKEGPQT